MTINRNQLFCEYKRRSFAYSLFLVLLSSAFGSWGTIGSKCLGCTAILLTRYDVPASDRVSPNLSVLSQASVVLINGWIFSGRGTSLSGIETIFGGKAQCSFLQFANRRYPDQIGLSSEWVPHYLLTFSLHTEAVLASAVFVDPHSRHILCPAQRSL